MAVLFDASTDRYTRTTGLMPTTTFTLMCWAVIDVNRVTTVTFFFFGTGSAGYFVQTASNGVQLRVAHASGGPTNGTTLTVGTWAHLALSVTSPGTGTCVLYRDGVVDVTLDGATGVSAGQITLAADSTPRWLNGRLAAFKSWDVALTQAEVQQEMWTYRPQRLDNINSWCPMTELTVANSVRDFSGFGRDLTVNGTLTAADGPPIAWDRQIWGGAQVVSVALAKAPPPRVQHWRFVRS